MQSVEQNVSGGTSALSLHHDLWVETARLEMAIENLDADAAGEADQRQQMEERRTRLRHAMRRLAE